MIYLILFVVFLVVLIWTCAADREGIGIFSLVMAVIFFIVSLSVIICGISEYMLLRSERKKIDCLVNGIEDVRESYYKQINIPKNNIINGSLDNMRQSTNLSIYTSEVIKEKAEFNKNLYKAQIAESEIIYNLFSDGFFISDKVHDIQPVE